MPGNDSSAFQGFQPTDSFGLGLKDGGFDGVTPGFNQRGGSNVSLSAMMAGPGSTASSVGGGIGTPLTGAEASDNDFTTDALLQQLEGMDYMPMDDLSQLPVNWGQSDPFATDTGSANGLGGGDGGLPYAAAFKGLLGEGGSSSAEMELEGTDSSVADELDYHDHDSYQDSHDLDHGMEDVKPGKKKQRTDPDRAKVSRDRNREHARNTRLRKKVYIETLREQLQKLTDERDKSERNTKVSMARAVEQQTVRKQVLQTFFIYRARGELDRRRWEAIVSEDFTMKLPVTPYRYFLASDVSDQARHLKGIDAMIRDTASLAVMVDSLGRTCRERVRIQFFAEADHIIVSGNSLMCRWIMKTENIVRCGGQIELQVAGMLQADFGEDNKLVRVVLTFDVMGLMQQLRRCSGKQGFQVTPSTLAMAEEPSDEPRMVLKLEAPHEIRSINESWVRTFGLTPAECQGKHMEIESVGGQGQGADPPGAAAVATVKDCLARELPHSVVLQYASKGRGPICARLKLLPLMAGGQLTHYLATLEPIFDAYAAAQPVILDFK